MTRFNFQGLPLTQRWSVPTDLKFAIGSPILRDDLLVCTYRGGLLALDRASGATRWRYGLAGELLAVRPFEDGPLLVLKDADGGSFILALTWDGAERWMSESPTVIDVRDIDSDATGLLVVGARAGADPAAVVIRQSDGATRATFDHRGRSNRLFNRGLISAASGRGGGLVFVNEDNTAQTLFEGPISIRARFDHRVYCQAYDRDFKNPTLLAFDVETLTEFWRRPIETHYSFFERQDALLVQEHNGSRTTAISAFANRTGEPIWSCPTEFNYSAGELFCVRDAILWAFDDGDIARFDPHTGALLARTDGAGASAIAPAVSDASVYFSDYLEVASFEWD